MALTLELRETIAAPPEKVFAVLADPDSLGKWMSGVVRIERLGGPAAGKGAKFRQVRKMFGREAGEVFEITSYDPPRSFDLFVDGRLGASGKGEYRFRYDLLPKAGGTEVVMKGEISGMGRFWEFLGKILGKLLCGMMKKAVSKDLASLKAYCEKAP
jgi:carbon monoxide dehydrogenase subunit G